MLQTDDWQTDHRRTIRRTISATVAKVCKEKDSLGVFWHNTYRTIESSVGNNIRRKLFIIIVFYDHNFSDGSRKVSSNGARYKPCVLDTPINKNYCVYLDRTPRSTFDHLSLSVSVAALFRRSFCPRTIDFVRFAQSLQTCPPAWQAVRRTGIGKLGRSKVGLGKLGLGKLGFGKVGRWAGKLGRGTTSKSAWVKVDLVIMFQL